MVLISIDGNDTGSLERILKNSRFSIDVAIKVVFHHRAAILADHQLQVTSALFKTTKGREVLNSLFTSKNPIGLCVAAKTILEYEGNSGYLAE